MPPRLTEAVLADVFQATTDNPLVGLAGRAALLRALGTAVAGAPQYFGADCLRLGQRNSRPVQRMLAPGILVSRSLCQ